MNINDLPGGTPDRVNGASSKIKPPHADFAKRKTESGEGTQRATHIPDPEVAELVDHLNSLPDVRTQSIQEARDRIQSGEFFSRQNAEATAEAFLR